MSGETRGDPVDLGALTDPSRAEQSGVAHAGTLLAFADSLVRDESDALSAARALLLEEVGPEALVDAAGVVSNFERMVRIANATGIPLDGPVHVMTEDLRAQLGIDRFASAAHTPPAGPGKRALGRVLRPLALGGIRLMAAWRRRSGRA